MELPMPTAVDDAAPTFATVESPDKSLPAGASDDLGPISNLLEGSNTWGPEAGIGLDVGRTYPLPKGYANGRRPTGAEARETEAATSVSYKGIRHRFFFGYCWLYIYTSRRRHHGDRDALSLSLPLFYLCAYVA